MMMSRWIGRMLSPFHAMSQGDSVHNEGRVEWI